MAITISMKDFISSIFIFFAFIFLLNAVPARAEICVESNCSVTTSGAPSCVPAACPVGLVDTGYDGWFATGRYAYQNKIFFSWIHKHICCQSGASLAGGSGPGVPSCQGSSSIANATLCSGDEAGLTDYTNYHLAGSCSADKCELTCNTNYTLSADGTACELSTPCETTSGYTIISGCGSVCNGTQCGSFQDCREYSWNRSGCGPDPRSCALSASCGCGNGTCTDPQNETSICWGATSNYDCCGDGVCGTSESLVCPADCSSGSCTGSAPTNASACSSTTTWTNQNRSSYPNGDTPRGAVTSCSGSGVCQYTCNANYIVRSGTTSCAPIDCSGCATPTAGVCGQFCQGAGQCAIGQKCYTYYPCDSVCANYHQNYCAAPADDSCRCANCSNYIPAGPCGYTNPSLPLTCLSHEKLYASDCPSNCSNWGYRCQSDVNACGWPQ